MARYDVNIDTNEIEDGGKPILKVIADFNEYSIALDVATLMNTNSDGYNLEDMIALHDILADVDTNLTDPNELRKTLKKFEKYELLDETDLSEVSQDLSEIVSHLATIQDEVPDATKQYVELQEQLNSIIDKLNKYVSEFPS